MVMMSGSRRLRRFTAQACTICYLILALAGAWHHHSHGDDGCVAGCPTHHDHRSGDSAGRADYSSIEFGARDGDCPLCIWSSSARVRPEIVGLAGRQLIPLGIRPAELDDQVTTLCFLTRQSRAPPANGTVSCYT